MSPLTKPCLTEGDEGEADMNTDLEIPAEEMIRRYEAIYTAAVIDILHSQYSKRNQALPSNLLQISLHHQE